MREKLITNISCRSSQKPTVVMNEDLRQHQTVTAVVYGGGEKNGFCKLLYGVALVHLIDTALCCQIEAVKRFPGHELASRSLGELLSQLLSGALRSNLQQT